MNTQLSAVLMLLIVSGAARAGEAEAIAALKKVGGTVEHEKNDPTKPVTGVELKGGEVKDENLKHLAAFSKLEDLSLELAENITDAGLKNLAALKTLKNLDLGATNVSDAGLKHLTGLKELTNLNLKSTKVTDAGVKELSKLKKLEEINLSSTNVTDAGAKKLQKALPKLKIVR